jgi:hypothetical protein
MKIYCSHKWIDSMACIEINRDSATRLEDIPVRLCIRCSTEWLKGDMMPEVEIGHTKE